MKVDLSGSACAVSTVPEIIISGTLNLRELELEDSTIYTSDGETFGDLPPMPYGLFSHCMVSLDNGDLFVTGGRKVDASGTPESDKSFLYHSDTMEWEELPGNNLYKIGLPGKSILS